MTGLTIRTATGAVTGAVTAQDVLAVLAGAGGGGDADRLNQAARTLAARLSAWDAADRALIGELRDQLRAASAQAADLSAARDRLREDFARLRRTVRTHVLDAVDDGALYNLLDEVDQAFRDGGMPGLPAVCRPKGGRAAGRATSPRTCTSGGNRRCGCSQ